MEQRLSSAKKIEPATSTRKCPNCNKPFELDFALCGIDWFCSTVCYEEYGKKVDKGEVKAIKCEFCGWFIKKEGD